MTDVRSLVIKNGTQQQIANTDTLVVGASLDAASGQALTIGGTNATSITIGSALVNTEFPGAVKLTGDVTTVGGTTFTTDATFEGNVTFGDANSDTVSFTSKVATNLVFSGVSATYKIQNLADPTSAQEAATKSYTDTQVATKVGAVTASAPLASSGGTSPDISLTGIVPVANGGTGTSTAFTSGSIVFAGASGVYSQDNAALFWDAANDRLGIGTATPSSSLSVAEKLIVNASGRLIEYNDAAPTDGQVLVGDTSAGYWKAATITAGTGVSITNGAGSITVSATGTGGTVTSVDVSGGTTGLTFSGGPITSSGTITMAGTLDEANGGTGQTSYSGGDLLYASGATALSKLAIGSANTVLRSNGTAPSWGSVALTTDVSGTLPVANGGTGTATAFTAGSIVFAGASGTYSQDNEGLFWDASNDRLGLGTATPSATLSVAEKFRVDSNGRMLEYNDAAPSDGQVLIGDGTAGYWKAATLSAAADSGVSVTNGAGTVSLAATGAVPLTTTGLTAGDVCYISANGTGSAAVATAAASARVAGVVSTVGASGAIKVMGIVSGVNFITTVGLAAGQPVYLSKTAGKLTNDVSGFSTGDVVAEIGLVVSATSATGGAAAASVLIQPKAIVVL